MIGVALLGGLAPDGGLYVPESWPEIDVHPSVARYTDVAIEVMTPYVAPVMSRDELRPLVDGAGHMVAGDRNDVFTNAVLRFLAEHT